MDDSFFGFDTSGPTEEDGGRQIEEVSEEEYDALNDETFGSAINGDWEEVHESLVRNLNCSKDDKRDINEEDNSDLEINLSRVKLDDVDLGSDDNESSRIQLDPSVWANPVKQEPQQNSKTSLYPTPENFLRTHFSNPFEQLQQATQNRFFGLQTPPIIPGKICTVEDIERNIRNQQAIIQSSPIKLKPIGNQPQQQQQPHSNVQTNFSLMQQQNHQQQQQQQPPHVNNFFNRSAPPGFNGGPRHNNYNIPIQHPLALHHGTQPRIPPGLPIPLMANHGLNGPQHPNFARPMAHNLQIALNNFAMHPSFNAIRSLGPPLAPRLPIHPGLLNQTGPVSTNHFNQRLVQEIQQNHPMLPGRNHNIYNPNSNHQNNITHLKLLNMKPQSRSNGNVPEEYDEYANLMSTRDKHWLINIQLSQLNTDTPYIDDYYYTVFKERRAKLSGGSQTKAHKDNQLNHPLTQPKGHAQLVLISMGKNGTTARNGQNRERKNSETNKNDKEQGQRIYPPLQFENSLGKLQFGSVTAPRKIIDMDVMGTDGTSQFNTTVELSTQRKSRQLLLHIETLYRIVLKLEDLENPAAIATSLVVKEKLDRERQLLAENSLLDLNMYKNKIADKSDSADNSVRSSLSEGFSYEPESRDKLMQKLLPCITTDKIVGMMNVRKGKILIRRIMPHIEDHPVRWNVWIGVFSSLQTVVRKDKDDTEGVLYALYSEFKKHISSADLEIVTKIAHAIPLTDKKLSTLFASKFSISSLIALILKSEEIYSKSDNINSELNMQWSNFLSNLSTSLSRALQHQTISAAIESDAVQPLVNHLTRFKELELSPLLALFSMAEQQTK